MTTGGQEGGTTGGPTVLRMLLGAHLRKLREARGVSREAAGWEIRASESKISRMELGRVGFKERDVIDLLALYGLDDADERDRLLALARDANLTGWNLFRLHTSAIDASTAARTLGRTPALIRASPCKSRL